MILCSSLVMLMTPGLAFFYGGLVGRRNVLAIMIQSFVSLCWTTVIWYVCGYSLCFSGDVGGVIGNLDMAFLRGVNLMAPSPNDSIPLIVHVAYQMMFAIITPALITGAFANRVTFKAYFIFEWLTSRKPKFLGLLTGSVAGLATITPAAGFVSPASAVMIGIVSGVVCYYAVALKNRLQWDDALDVWGVHGVGGFIGILMLGLFASKAVNPGGADGLLAGNSGFFVKQLVAVLFSSAWAFVFTFAMLWLIDRFTPVKVAAGTGEAGLDALRPWGEAYDVGAG